MKYFLSLVKSFYQGMIHIVVLQAHSWLYDQVSQPTGLARPLGAVEIKSGSTVYKANALTTVL